MNRTRFLLPLVLASLLAPFMGVPANAATEGACPEQTTAQPVPITFPVDCSGDVRGIEDSDNYSFLVTESSLLRLTFTTDGSLRYLVAGANVSYESRAPSSEAVLWLEPGSYLISLSGQPTTANPLLEYHLRGTLTPATPTPDCGSPGDAPPSGARQTHYSGDAPRRMLPDEVACAAALDAGDVNDLYVFTMSGDHAYRVTITTGSSDALRVYSLHHLGGSFGWGATHLLPVPSFFLSDPGVTRQVAFQVARSGDATTWGDRIDYSIAITREPLAAGDDCGSGLDLAALHGAVLSRSLAPSEACEASLGGGDLGDAFELAPPSEPSILRMTATSTGVTRFRLGGDARTETYLSPHRPGPQTLDLYVHGQEPRLWAEFTGSGNYTVEYTYLPDPQNDCGLGHDAPASIAVASHLPGSGVACTGRLERGDGEDVYLMDTGPRDLVEVEYTFASYSGFAPVAVGNVDGGSGESYRYGSDYRYAFRTNGPSYTRVVQNANLSYTVKYTHTPASAIYDCGLGDDANRGRGLVGLLRPGSGCAGAFTSFFDRVDDYDLPLQAGEAVVVTATTPKGADLRLGYRDFTGTQTLTSSALVTPHPEDSTLEQRSWLIPSPAARTHDLRFVAGPTGFAYRLDVGPAPEDLLGRV
ncbi:MAG TPA: hypothetical protein VNZ52_00610 [Candidatus Thermoplasmatota archaeon]|nr:hypothetical protein [Candidatus Thermoplasmatota archaeon]